MIAVAASEQVSESTDAPKTINQEIELIDELYSIYRSYLDASKDQQRSAEQLAKAEEDYAACKDETNARRENVDQFLKTFPERLLAIRDPNAQAIVESIKTAIEDAADPETADASVKTMDYDEWRKLPTQSIVDKGIPGLGKKKADSLLENFPTLGELEDKRSEASVAHKHFCEVLGKGFGKNIADAIENAMQELLIPSSQPNSSAQPAGEPSTDSVPTDISQESEEGSDSSLDPDDELDEPEYAEADEDEWEEVDDTDETSEEESDDTSWIQGCVATLRDDIDERKSSWGATDSEHTPEWEAGGRSQRDGWSVESCPHDDSAAGIQWIRGWLAAADEIDL